MVQETRRHSRQRRRSRAGSRYVANPSSPCRSVFSWERIGFELSNGIAQYGGSTVICVFPSVAGVVLDEDILTHSKAKMETLVKVGMEMGKLQSTV